MRSVKADIKYTEWREVILKPDGSIHREQKGTTAYRPHLWERSDITKVPYVNGFRAPTPYRSYSFISLPMKLNASRTAKDGWGYRWVDEVPEYLWGFPPLLPEDASLRSVLVYRCLAKVKDEKINLAVALAEIDETVKLIASHMTKIRKAFSAAKRGDWKRVYDTLGIGRNYRAGRRDLASGWLEVIYGWLPLLADINGAVQEINRKVLEKGYTIVGRARYENSDTTTTVIDRFYRVGLCSARLESEYLRRHEQKAAMYFRIDMPSLQRAAATGLLNPLALAWELAPYSFLADWVSTVGDWLSSLDATVGLTYLGGSHTYYANLNLSGQKAWELNGGKIAVTPGTFSQETMNRTVLNSSAPDEKLVFTSPWSTSHAITAVALTVTTLKTR